MTSEARVIVAPAGGPAFEIAPHHCFACGTLNEHGLRLDLHLEHARSWTELRIAPGFQGWDEIAHGGILCTVLDEVMAWSLVAEDHWGVTARLAVEFKAPVAIDQLVRAEGWIVSSKRRIVHTEARLTDVATGRLLARATGTYVAADADRKEELRSRYGVRRLDRVTGPGLSPGRPDPVAGP